MKTSIHQLFLMLCFVLFSIQISAQQKQIKVQIMHEDKVVVDTTLYKTSAEAKVIIENLVQRFSTDPVTIDTKLTHGLYVFNISNDSWIDPNTGIAQATVTEDNIEKAAEKTEVAKIENSQKTVERSAESNDEKVDTNVEPPAQSTSYDDIAVDSLFREFSKELDTHWNEAHIDIIIDSVGSSFKQIWEEIRSGDFQNDPDIKNLKNDFEKLFEKIKTTQIIIIQDSDTIKVD